MEVDRLIGMIDATFDYFGSLGDWYEDPAGVEAVCQVRDRMVRDLGILNDEASKDEVAELCREWRASRIEPTEDATYPPDKFSESVCQAIDIS